MVEVVRLIDGAWVQRPIGANCARGQLFGLLVCGVLKVRDGKESAVMKAMIAGLSSLVLGVSLSSSAFAQSAPGADQGPGPNQPAPGQASGAGQVQGAGAPGEAAPPASQWVYSYPTGQWVYTADNGWVWVPAAATQNVVDGVPYSYLYTPAYGWTWYVSPWGWGPYHYGAWVTHPWRPYGWRGGWVAHPRGAFRGGGHFGRR